MANLGPTNIEGNLVIKNQTYTPNMSSDGTSSRVVVLDDDGILRYKTNFADVNHNHDSITGYASGIEGGTISDLNAIWSVTKNNGAYVYRFNSNALNIPPGVLDNANWVMNIYSHGVDSIGSYGHQLAGGTSGDIYFRRVIDGGFYEWKKLWNSSNFDPATKLDTTTINGTQNYLTKYGATGITQSNIYDNGTNVGIGTDNPQYPLSIKSASSAATLQLIGRHDDYSNLVFTNADSTPNFLIEAGTNAFKLYSFNTGVYNPRLTLQLNGNLGIGTTTPRFNLDFGKLSIDNIDNSYRFSNGERDLISDFYPSKIKNTLLSASPDSISLDFYIANANYTGVTELSRQTLGLQLYGNGNAIIPNGKVGINTLNPSEKLEVNGIVKANGYKVGSGANTKLLTDGGDTKLITDFATSTHNHDGIYSTTDTKNTAGATNTSSKIYLVGSTEQTANPQTYTHDTAYVGVDGNVYSGNSKTITNSDLLTNQIVTPTLNPTWTIRNYAGTVISSPTNPSGEAINGTSIVLEYGFKPSMTVKGKWITQVGYDDPISCSGLCGTSLPASNVETAATSSINLYNSTTYSNTVVPITTSDYWTIFTPKKGITVSGSSLVLPTGNISASARTQVTYQLPIYYGNVTTLSVTEAIIKALSTKTWKNYQTVSKTLSTTINSSDSEYWVYAYPATWGNLSTISNADGDWTAAFTLNTVNITSASGLTVVYNYYITVNKGAFKGKIINFS